MKNIILYYLFSLFFFNYSFAQQYYPLVQENVHWQSLEGSGSYIYTYPRGLHFFIDGDTSINNQTYSILNYYDIERGGPPWTHPFLVDSSEAHVFGFLREDTLQRKVYIRATPYGNMEHILFDFSLAVGDTLISNYATEGDTLIVTQITTVTLLDGSQRLKWIFDNSFGNTFSYIEGIGGSHGYFYPMIVGLGWWYTMECYTVNNTPLYGSDSYWPPPIQCFDFIATSTIPFQREDKVYPNPTKNQLTIERPQEGKASFQLYNNLGQLVLETSLEQQQETILLGPLTTGIYRYTINQQQAGTLIIQ